MKPWQIHEQKAEEFKAAALKMLEDADGPLEGAQNAAYENLRGKVESEQAFAKELKDAELDRLQDIVATQASTKKSDKFVPDFRNMARDQEFILVPQDALSEGATPGSYLVGEEWAAQVAEYRFEQNFLRQNGAQVIKTNSTHNIPILSANGVAAITGENAAYTAVDPTIVPLILHAYKLTQKTPVSEELLSDSAYDVPGTLAKSVGYGFAHAEEDYFLTGSGSGQPTGILNKTADKTLAGATAITKDELLELLYTVSRVNRRGAGWMMADSTALYIAKLKLDVTTSGTTPYFWTDSVGGEPPMLLGYPVWTHSGIAALGATNKALAFGAPANYVIGERGPMVSKRLVLNEYSDTFAFNHRIDGAPVEEAAFAVAACHA